MANQCSTRANQKVIDQIIVADNKDGQRQQPTLLLIEASLIVKSLMVNSWLIDGDPMIIYWISNG